MKREPLPRCPRCRRPCEQHEHSERCRYLGMDLWDCGGAPDVNMFECKRCDITFDVD